MFVCLFVCLFVFWVFLVCLIVRHGFVVMVHGYLGGGERLAEQVERVDDPVNKPVMDNNTWMWMDEYKDD